MNNTFGQMHEKIQRGFNILVRMKDSDNDLLIARREQVWWKGLSG